MNHLNWTQRAKSTITPIKHLLARMSMLVRGSQFKLLIDIFSPTAKTKVLDVGSTSDETLKDSNLFLKLYPFPRNLTTATIEDSRKIQKLYPKIRVEKITPGKILPYKDKTFDLAVSWATIEHVGGYGQQRFFINELVRVSKNIFLTTPYRGCPYEPHTGFWFLHWLPLSWFRWFCRLTKQDFLSQEKNLNPLFVNDIRQMSSRKDNIKIKVYKMFGILPSHLIIYSNNK